MNHVVANNPWKHRVEGAIYQAFAIMLGIFIILPIVYAFLISCMPANEILRRPPKFIPKQDRKSVV